MNIRCVIISFLILVQIYAVSSCNISSSSQNESPYGSRDYTWSVDTIKSKDPYLRIYRTWGTGPENSWFTTKESQVGEYLWYYEKGSWKPETKFTYSPLNSICGSSKSDIWVTGYGRDIWHYNGNNWLSESQFPSTAKIFSIENLVYDNNDTYVGVGIYIEDNYNNFGGTIVQRSNNKWEQVYILPSNKQKPFVMYHIVFAGHNQYLISALEDIRNEFVYSYNSKTKHLVLIDSSRVITRLAVIGGGAYVKKNNSIYSAMNDTLIHQFDYNVPGDWDLMGLEGRDHNDLFSFVNNSGIVHYNGIDWQIIFPIHCRQEALPLIYKNDVFFFVSNYETPPKMLVIHGTMNKE